MNDKHIEIFIKNKCNEISSEHKEDIHKLLPFYSDILDDDLAYLFSYLHDRLNSLFQLLINTIIIQC